jgi:hypothetical protein
MTEKRAVFAMPKVYEFFSELRALLFRQTEPVASAPSASPARRYFLLFSDPSKDGLIAP